LVVTATVIATVAPAFVPNVTGPQLAAVALGLAGVIVAAFGAHEMWLARRARTEQAW